METEVEDHNFISQRSLTVQQTKTPGRSYNIKSFYCAEREVMDHGILIQNKFNPLHFNPRTLAPKNYNPRIVSVRNFSPLISTNGILIHGILNQGILIQGILIHGILIHELCNPCNIIT